MNNKAHANFMQDALWSNLAWIQTQDSMDDVGTVSHTLTPVHEITTAKELLAWLHIVGFCFDTKDSWQALGISPEVLTDQHHVVISRLHLGLTLLDIHNPLWTAQDR